MILAGRSGLRQPKFILLLLSQQGCTSLALAEQQGAHPEREQEAHRGHLRHTVLGASGSKERSNQRRTLSATMQHSVWMCVDVANLVGSGGAEEHTKGSYRRPTISLPTRPCTASLYFKGQWLSINWQCTWSAEMEIHLVWVLHKLISDHDPLLYRTFHCLSNPISQHFTTSLPSRCHTLEVLIHLKSLKHISSTVPYWLSRKLHSFLKWNVEVPRPYLSCNTSSIRAFK